MTSSLSLDLAAIGAAALCLVYMRRDTRPVPPGPRPLPLVGNLLDLPKHEQWLVYQEWSRRYGSDVVHMNVLGTDIVVVNSAQAAAALLGQKSAIYSDRPRMPMLGELVGLGWHFGFMPHGDNWRAHRKLFAQESGASAIQGYNEQETKWIKTFLKNLRDDPKEFLMHIQHMASGLALETTFGLQVQPSGQPDPFIAATKQAVEALTETGLFGTYFVDFLPALKYIPSWFPYATFRRQAKEWRKSSDIAAHVPYELLKKNIATNDYVPSIGSKILSAGVEEEETVVRQTTAAMFANGSAAVVSALSTFILAMRLYPEVQAKAQKEIDQVVSGRLPDTSDEANLPYITAIVREVGRWQPVVPLAFPHMLSADDTYEGYHLKAGSIVFPNAWAILHDPNVYPEPHIFRPERFLTTDGTLNPDVKDPDAVWGFGRRACPGRKMGHSTLFGAIAAMLATFDVKPAFDENGKIIVPSGEYGAGMLRYPKAFECRIETRSVDAMALISAD
ncbi:cytochrome P450 [Roridomyces roridus]|uniref:Cytochrome P450 n=1 Tax=Roridomyces roridus TaxID=1738132 RepID=A0AAD7BZ88_9AGAR|nr:cytochrome P450 [Roridomyces roridus]